MTGSEVNVKAIFVLRNAKYVTRRMVHLLTREFTIWSTVNYLSITKNETERLFGRCIQGTGELRDFHSYKVR
jgi:hypothetical protein